MYMNCTWNYMTLHKDIVKVYFYIIVKVYLYSEHFPFMW